MARQGISTGSSPNDGLGDSLLAGAIKINSNFTEIYNVIGNGTTLGIASLTQLRVSGNSLITGISTVGIGSTSTPPNNSQLSFELISNTQLRIKVRGTDGVLRSANITLS